MTYYRDKSRHMMANLGVVAFAPDPTVKKKKQDPDSILGKPRILPDQQPCVQVPPLNGNGAHIHKNTEVFIFLTGKWEIGFGHDAQV